MEYCHPGSPSVKKFKTLMSATKVMLTIYWNASGVLYTEFLSKGLTVNSDRYCATLQFIKQRNYKMRPERKRLSFASRQCKTALQCTNTGRYGKTEIHSGSTTFLQPRFGFIGLLVVPKSKGDVERSTLFSGCRISGRMDTQPTSIFLHRRNEEMDRRIELMCSC
ncbi:hypothetical protein TNCV_4647541 [Trichonephila clavipes]|uniref:Uncharacterized protein n=1 Tax=Trichonephila clavipes TaxID=2585209 RepID=A0A8X6VI61_TRICX|nr:hypothetical protein TNCV_4647541 [Trichonephila clavipes]